MYYQNVIQAVFINRPNRFVANVSIDGEEQLVHVKNTGRCKELLVPGCTVYLAPSGNAQRKTKYDLIAVQKKRGILPPLLVNIDSQIVNDAVAEWLPKSGIFSEKSVIRREVTKGTSRFDFYINDGATEAFLEVKGVTLENDGIAMFPDAPTERGIKHINELISCVREGYRGYIIFVIQMKEVPIFKPNEMNHKAFADALRTAKESGVNILVVDCNVTMNSIEIDSFVALKL